MKKGLRLAVLGLLALIFVFPILMTVTNSFMTARELDEVYSGDGGLRLIPKRISLEGYEQLLISNASYLRMFWNSVMLALSIAGGSMIVSLLVAFALAKCRIPGARSLRFVYIVLMMMPFQVTLLPNYLVMRMLGLYDTLWALILPGVFVPFGVFLLCQFLRDMPEEEIEAASLETSSAVRTLTWVVAPRIYPALLAMLLLSFAEAWNMVEQPLILLKSQELYPLSLALNSQNAASQPVAFAGSVLYMAPILILYGLFDEELTQGLSAARL